MSVGSMEHDGDVTIESDYDVLNFYAYNKINGSLIIESTDVTDVKLPDLEEITGSLRVCYNELLTDIKDLGSLKKIGGDLKIEHNDALPTEQAQNLSEQATIGGSVSIDGNKGGVVASEVFEGDVKISCNTDAKIWQNFIGFKGSLQIDGLLVNSVVLPNLKTIGGDLFINATALRSLHGLENVEQIGGELSIINNESLLEIELTNLKEIGKDLLIQGNPIVGSIEGIANLSKVGGNFEVFSNEDLPMANAERVKEKVAVGGDTTINDNNGFEL